MSEDDIKFAMRVLKNSGIDVECGACMEVAFSGVTTNQHTCIRLVHQSNHADVGDFHEKFKLDNTTYHAPGPRRVSHELIRFRLNFMLEELLEFAEAHHFVIGFNPITGKFEFNLPGPNAANAVEDTEKSFDALLDLAYVVFGTAHVLGYPWQQGWDEVQRANMAKERCEIDHAYVPRRGPGIPDYVSGCNHQNADGYCGADRAKHSLRGNINDVIKPRGWTAPDIDAVLKKHGF